MVRADYAAREEVGRCHCVFPSFNFYLHLCDTLGAKLYDFLTAFKLPNSFVLNKRGGQVCTRIQMRVSHKKLVEIYRGYPQYV